jgi:VanZ family protein
MPDPTTDTDSGAGPGASGPGAAGPELSGTARWVMLGLGAGWFVVVFRLALLETSRTIPGLGGNSDELAHLLAWAGLAAVLFLALDRPGRSLLLSAVLLAVSALVGVAVEVAQLSTENRSFELSDVVFDVVGAWLGLSTAWVLSRTLGRRGLAAVLAGAAAVVLLTLLVTEPAAEDLGPTAGSRSCERRPFEPASPADAADPLLLWPMDEGDGEVAAEVGGGPPLEIADENDTPWAPDGGLIFSPGSSSVGSGPAGEAFSQQARASDAFSIEVWFSAAALPQYGPARVVTVSNGTDSSVMNAHVGIEDHGISIRVRTDCDESNEVVVQDLLEPATLHHVVLTYHPGEIVLAVDGQVVARSRVFVGGLDVWDADLPLVLGDEATGDRPLEGTIRRVALYDEALDPDQIARSFQSGP